jgi:hypothetical protein
MCRTRSGQLGVPGSRRRRAKSDTHHRFVYERPAKPVRLLRDRIHFVLCVPLAGLSISSPQVAAVRSRSGRTHALWESARINRLGLGASAARTPRPCGESLLELSFQTLGRDVMFSLTLDRDLDPDPRGLKADYLHVVGHVLPV